MGPSVAASAIRRTSSSAGRPAAIRDTMLVGSKESLPPFAAAAMSITLPSGVTTPTRGLSEAPGAKVTKRRPVPVLRAALAPDAAADAIPCVAWAAALEAARPAAAAVAARVKISRRKLVMPSRSLVDCAATLRRRQRWGKYDASRQATRAPAMRDQ